MGVGVDRDAQAALLGCLRMNIGEIHAIGTAIDLEKAANGFCVLEQSLHVQFVSRPLQEQPAGCMPKNGEIAIVHGAQNPLGLLILVQSESRVNGADCKVKFLEHVVRIVELAVRKDINLRRLENAKAIEFGVELIDGAICSASLLESPWLYAAIAVVGDGDVPIALARAAVAMASRCRRVARRGVHVEVAANRRPDKRGQCP